MQVQCLHPVSRLHPKAVWMAVTGEHLRLHPRQNRKLLRMIMAHAKFIQVCSFLLTTGEPPVGRTQELRDRGTLAIEVGFGMQNETINAP